MKTYWELSGKERLAVTIEDIDNTYLLVDLMMEGIAIPPKPIPPIRPDIRSLSGGTAVYKIAVGYSHTNLAFRTAEEANEAIKNALIIDITYAGGKGIYTFEDKDASIESVVVHNKDSISDIVAAEQAFEKEMKEYKETKTTYDNATKESEKFRNLILLDWRQIRDRDDRYRIINQTLNEYTRLSGGDEAIAENFLFNTRNYRFCDIIDFFIYTGREIPEKHRESANELGVFAVDYDPLHPISSETAYELYQQELNS